MKKPKAKKLSTGSPQVAEVPPGLKIVNRLANAPNRTPRRNARLRRMESFAPDSDIYRWNSILPSSPAKSSSKKDKVPSKSDQAKVNPVKNVSTFNAKQQRRDFKWLQFFLLNCGQQKRRKTKETKSFPSKTSSERKLEVSEISCKRKPPLKTRERLPGKVVLTTNHQCLQCKVSALLNDKDPNGSSFNMDDLPDLLPGYIVTTVGGSRRRGKQKKKVSEAKSIEETEHMKIETTTEIEASDTATSMSCSGSAVHENIVTAGEDLVRLLEYLRLQVRF